MALDNKTRARIAKTLLVAADTLEAGGPPKGLAKALKQRGAAEEPYLKAVRTRRDDPKGAAKLFKQAAGWYKKAAESFKQVDGGPYTHQVKEMESMAKSCEESAAELKTSAAAVIASTKPMAMRMSSSEVGAAQRFIKSQHGEKRGRLHRIGESVTMDGKTMVVYDGPGKNGMLDSFILFSIQPPLMLHGITEQELLNGRFRDANIARQVSASVKVRAAKLSKKKQDQMIEKAFGKTGAVVDIMDIGKIFDEGYKALKEDPTGGTLQDAIDAFAKKIKKN